MPELNWASHALGCYWKQKEIKQWKWRWKRLWILLKYFLTGSMDTFHEEMKVGSFSVWESLYTHLWLLSDATLPTNLSNSNTTLVNTIVYALKAEIETDSSFWFSFLTLLQSCRLHESSWRKYQHQTFSSHIHFQLFRTRRNHRSRLPIQESWSN